MMPVSYLQTLKALAPEAVLVLGALVALSADLARLRNFPACKRNYTLGLITIIAALLAVVPLCRQWCAWHPLSLLNGTLLVDHLTITFKFVILVLTILTALISMNFDLGRHVGEYYAVLLFGAIGMMLLISAEELIMIFVALELTSISLYILTAFHKGTLKSQEAAVKYFMFGAISSAFLLFGLSYVFGITGTTMLRALPEAIKHATAAGSSPLLAVGLLFVVIGFGFKIAIVPFHLWAPDAYEGAPTPVTAYIATGSKVASFFVLVKLMIIGFAGLEGAANWGACAPGWTLLLAVTATLSMVLGNCAAIVQNNVKRLLAYSSIAHAGYILIGLIAATKFGATSVLFYVIVYGLTNLGAFGVVAAISSAAGGDDLDHFRGLSKRAPVLSLLMLIFILSLAGVPPLGGFFGKFYLFAAAVQRDSQSFGLLWLVIIGILMSAVSLYYYLILLKQIYVLDPVEGATTPIAVPRYLTITLALVALSVVLLGVFPERVLALLNELVTKLYPSV